MVASMVTNSKHGIEKMSEEEIRDRLKIEMDGCAWFFVFLLTVTVALIIAMMCGVDLRTPSDRQMWLKDGYGGAQFLQGGGRDGAMLCEGTETDGRIGSLPYAVGCEQVSWDYVLKTYPNQRSSILEYKKYLETD